MSKEKRKMVPQSVRSEVLLLIKLLLHAFVEPLRLGKKLVLHVQFHLMFLELNSEFHILVAAS